MATWGGCLCLILTLWMAGSGRPAIDRTVASDPWWGTKEARDIETLADGYRAARDFAAVEAVDQRGYQRSLQRRDDRAAFAYLTGMGAARLLQHRYRDAFEVLLRARQIALRLGDRASVAAVAVNLSSLYLQTWDLESALRAAEEGLSADTPSRRTYYRLPLILQLGKLHQMLGDGRAAGFFLAAIEEARVQNNAGQEARAWDVLGEERLRIGEVDLAERDAEEAFRLRRSAAPLDLPWSYARLGAVKLAQGDLDPAERFTDRAIAASDAGASVGFPRYLLMQQRGEIRLAHHDRAGALRDFSAAVDGAGLWRQGGLPARSSLVAANVGVETRVFRSYIETAAAEALRSHSNELAQESFEAAELNRSASMRDSLALRETWRRKLPLEYWQAAAQLRAEQRPERTAQLELALTEMEAKAGLQEFSNNIENFRGQDSLIDFRRGLSNSAVFLSLYLGEKESYLWAVTQNSLSIHRLPAAQEIRSEIRKFRRAIRGASSSDRPNPGAEARSESDAAEVTGGRLYTVLFGQLSKEEAAKPEWLLSLDDELFELPFPALVTGRQGGGLEYLVENHSVQVVPGALALMGDLTGASRARRGGAEPRNRARAERDWFLGVGDPIYNSADPRWSGGWFGTLTQYSMLTWFSGTPRLQLNRLVGSGAEVGSSARSWTGDRGESDNFAKILTGADARRDQFLELAAGKPAVIHLATHVIARQMGGQKREQVAFGIDPSGAIETLSATDVAAIDASGAVIAMTGCASGAGDIEPGAGLLGLTRAWQVAGARAVIATGWPVSDTSGGLFEIFYRNLRSESPAEAMRRSQVEMIHSGSWRSNPSYWAAYGVSAGANSGGSSR